MENETNTIINAETSENLTTEENTVSNDTEQEIVQDIVSQNTAITTQTVIIESDSTVTLDTIHEDLGIICSFLIIGAVLIFFLILYKLFNLLLFGD